MHEAENYFTTAIRLLQAHERSNEPVTGRTLLSLLTILERNEMQHARDFAALDTLTRTLTSVVSHMVEDAIGDADTADDLGGVLAHVQSLSERIDLKDANLRDVTARRDLDGRPNDRRSDQGRRELAAQFRDEVLASGTMPKRSFSDAVAEIGRRHSSRIGLVLDHEDIQSADASLGPSIVDEIVADADQDTLETIFGQLDRLTTQVERSERVLASLPTLVESVQGLIEEFEAPLAPALDGARRSQHELAAALALPRSGRAAHDQTPPLDEAEASHDAFALPAPAQEDGGHAAARVRSTLDGQRPPRIRSSELASPNVRRWQGLASACALFAALTVTAVVQVANGHADTDVRPRQAMVAAAGVADTGARSSLLSGERIAREPSSLTMPLLAERMGSVTVSRKLVEGEASAGAQAASLYQLGLRSVEGRAVPQDYRQAACFFEHAAGAGSVPAQYRLAVMLERGIGTTKDLGKARDLYRRAALAGHVRAMHNLAVMLSTDKRPSAYGNAAFWFARAAHLGVTDSQYNLGMLFAQGLGVKRSALQAFEWFAVAAGQGDKGALGKRDEIASQLSPADLKAGRRFAAAFKPDTPDPDSNGASPSGADAAALPVMDLAGTCPAFSDGRLRYSTR